LRSRGKAQAQRRFLFSNGPTRLCDVSSTTSYPEPHWVEYIQSGNQGEDSVVSRPGDILEAVRTNQKKNSDHAERYLTLLIGNDAEDDEQHLEHCQNCEINNRLLFIHLIHIHLFNY